ncbi:hypothetical protein IIQ_01334 [Bacillus cereus VD118]|uniref:Uncharacterized protein n=1 Tax=Bacillus cereus VD118 TaxID=1053231 RepID=R8QIN2_BACCE|nr:hypothetical protein IIQ_01334 [Bacillus cereus VD118]CAH2465814.1 hypothetical protein ACOSJ1_EBGNOMHC_01269 [Bacillus mycoides KBAB4]
MSNCSKKQLLIFVKTFVFIAVKVFQNQYVYYLLACASPAINLLPEYVPFCIKT